MYKHWPTSGGQSNVKRTYFPVNSQDPLKIRKIFEQKFHFGKNVYEKYNTTVVLFK